VQFLVSLFPGGASVANRLDNMPNKT